MADKGSPRRLGYTSAEVARLLGLSVGRIRSYVRAGFLAPDRVGRGRLRFSFQDLVLLRAAKELVEKRVAPRRVRAALAKLRSDLPQGRPLSGLSISADAGRVVVRDGRSRWNPESGQRLFDFEIAEIARRVAPLARQASEPLRAEEWFELGCEIEASSPAEARDAYRRSIELDPDHTGAHTNLGRLLHEEGELAAAEAHYRAALRSDAEDATAAFNLGVVLEDSERPAEAIAAYEQAVAADRRAADAHYNLARLYEKVGNPAAAVRHWKSYRRLVKSATKDPPFET